MATTKLHQIIAVEKGTKTRVYADLSESHKALQKEELFNGHAKVYRPKDEDPTHPLGERIPDDNRKVTFKVTDTLRETAAKMSELFDLAAARDWSNCGARASVVVDGKKLLDDVPVTYLLFLEKQLADMHTFVKKLPTLNPSEHWNFNEAQDLYATVPVETVRTKKITRPLVLYPHTEQHPAQVKEVTEDVMTGTWTTTKYSSALPANKVNEMLRRIETLQKAVKFAREEANGQDVTEPKVGGAVFSYIFGPALGERV